MSDHDRVRCSGCGATRQVEDPRIDEAWPACACGSTAVTVEKTLTDAAVARETLSLKARHEGVARPHVEVKSGSSFFVRDQRWHVLERRIDREKDWYDEVISDETTGAVVREVHEPLHEHAGRGSARAPKNGV